MITDAKIVCKDADQKDYHAQTAERGTPEFTMTSSAMREFARCAERWKDGYVSPDSESKSFGSIVDMLVLTPHRFQSSYAVRPATYPAPDTHAKVKARKIKAGDPLKWNSNSKWCEAWDEEHESNGLEVVSAEDHSNASRAVDKILRDDILGDFVNSSDRQIWLSAVWKDKPTGIEVPVKCLLDLVPRLGTEWFKCLGDTKCVRNASNRAFKSQIFELWWHTQAAFYTDVYVASSAEDRCEWNFVVVENYKPFQIGRKILEQPLFELGRKWYKQVMRAYCQSLKTGQWSNYESTDDSVQGWSIIRGDEWMFNSNPIPTKEIQAQPIEDDLPEPTDVGH